FAQVATGLLPPGVLGHDPGRRRPPLSKEKAAELLTESGIELPAPLRVAAHPAFLGRYRAMLDAIGELWGELGLEMQLVSHGMESFLATATASEGVDARVG